MDAPSEDKIKGLTLLRSRAEQRLREGESNLGALTAEQLQATVHELHVHQVELEMQNEQLRLTQAELENTSERYAALYDYAPVGYVSINEPGFIVAANLTSVHMLGVERSRLVGSPLRRLVRKQDQDNFYLCIRNAFNSSLTQACEIQFCPPGGTPFEARIELIRAEDEGSTVCNLTISDITEQKRAQEALRLQEQRQLQYENEERLRLAFDAGDLGAWDQDLTTGRIVCSDRAYAMLGIAPGSSVTWDIFTQRVHPDDRAAFLNLAEQSSQPKSSGRFDAVFRTLRRDGSCAWLRFAARYFFDRKSGKAVRRTGVLADITHQKETEELLESRAKHLDVLVQERTARLQDAVGELEHFSYTLAHDLRAPLRAIRGYSEILLDKSDGLRPEHRLFLERSSSAARRMDQLIQDALNYNKIVRHSFTLETVDCGKLLNELIDSYPQFQQARESIVIRGNIPPVLGNPALLTQCFSNLLGNALKFVAPGREPAISVFARELSGRVRIWFEDNGIGIPENCHSKIFEMFQRLNNQYEGTGIGLALVKKAAQRMHGSVGLQSEPGVGSRFWIELDKPDTVPE